MEEKDIDDLLDLLEEEEEFHERRKSVRKKTDIPFRFMIKNSRGVLAPDVVRARGGKVVDVSKTGLGIVTEEALCNNDRFYIETMDDTYKFVAEATVVHNRRSKIPGEYRFGCVFNKILR